MLFWIWITVAVSSVVLWFKWRYSYFRRRGLISPPTVPLFGNMYQQLTKKKHVTSAMSEIYQNYPNHRFIGIFELTSPTVFVRDPELLRKIAIKDFDYFTNHRSVQNDNDPLFTRNLIGLKDQKWRDMRAMLSPAFTGSKLRHMIPLMMDCNKILVKHLQKEIDQKSDKAIDIDTHDLLTRYTNDVIATCVFGLQSDSFSKTDTVYQMASKMISLSPSQVLKIFLMTAAPFISKVFNMEMLPKESTDFFRHIVLDTMKNRDENNTFRPDMIQILLEAKKGTLKHEQTIDVIKDAGFATVEESDIGKSAIKKGWTDDDLVAQAFAFYFAGFDTVSTCMKFLLLELAINLDIQDRLRKEIQEHHEKNQGKVDYEKLNELKYLDMVISETLRKWPPAVNTDRVCTKPYNLGKSSDDSKEDFIVKRGMTINIPIYPIHHDPEYYSNPDKFDPERFSDENKHKINQFIYMPFGIGPRNCIGSRFALSEVKTMTYELIRHFEVSPALQTVLPPRYDKTQFMPRLEGGHWLRFKNISKSTS